VTTPERALEEARDAVRRKRQEGAYGPPEPGALEDSVGSARASLDLLAEWAVLAPDPDAVYSTRRLGAPITALKQLLLRLLRQYHWELEAQQTRFNIGILENLGELERRVSALERAREE
jgi:hypothetical protein